MNSLIRLFTFNFLLSSYRKGNDFTLSRLLEWRVYYQAKEQKQICSFQKILSIVDLIDVDRFTIKPVKRISIPHTLLTFQDQLNLERQLVFYFFPGLSIDSEKYIITLYQNNGQRYLLFWTWEGRPRYRYDFPKDYEIYGLCGDGENQIYALGVDSKNSINYYIYVVIAD